MTAEQTLQKWYPVIASYFMDAPGKVEMLEELKAAMEPEPELAG